MAVTRPLAIIETCLEFGADEKYLVRRSKRCLLRAELNPKEGVWTTLEAIRKKVCQVMGVQASQSIPKISFIASVREYRRIMRKTTEKELISLLARVMAMGKMHKTFAVTAGIPAAVGAVISDSVVNRIVFGGQPVSVKNEIVIGHPSGVMDLRVDVTSGKGELHIVS